MTDPLLNPQFGTVRWREGYAPEGVDGFVAQVRASFLAKQATVTPRDVAEQRFVPVWVSAGYDRGEVDAWSDAVIAELRRREAGRPASGSEAHVRERWARPAREPSTEPVAGDAVVEVRSSFPAWTRVVAVVLVVALVAFAIATAF